MPGRGSAGGSRGRGRGGLFAAGSSLMGGFTYAEMKEVALKQTALYPEYALPRTAEPSNTEKKYNECAIEYEQAMDDWKLSADPSHGKPLEHFTSDEFRRIFQKDCIPASLWDSLFENKRTRSSQQSSTKKKRRKLDLDQLAQQVAENTGTQGDREQAPSDEDADSLSESEEEDLDYEQNYFDNGEGDDEQGDEDNEGVME